MTQQTASQTIFGAVTQAFLLNLHAVERTLVVDVTEAARGGGRDGRDRGGGGRNCFVSPEEGEDRKLHENLSLVYGNNASSSDSALNKKCAEL